MRESEFYKEKIINMLEKISNVDILIKIYTFVKAWYK
jgi:thymidine kinase